VECKRVVSVFSDGTDRSVEQSSREWWTCYLLIYCLVQQRVYQSRVHDVEELLDIWHDLQQSAADSAVDGQRVFAPAYGPKEDILSSDNRLCQLSERSLKQWSSVPNARTTTLEAQNKQLVISSKFVKCVF